jgi:HD-like signal output (HDOD) protein
VISRGSPESELIGSLSPASLSARLGQVFSLPSYRAPMLPTVALQVMELSRKPGVDFDEVLAILERDGMLAGRVLSIAQSAMYAGRSSIVSLRQALVRLGIKTLRNVVLEAALNLRVFRVPGYEPTMERLRRHSSTTAHLASLVARHGKLDPEAAFVCGLLHDVGMAAALLAIVESTKGVPPPIEDLSLGLDAVHAQASGLLTGLWKLPPEVQRAVSRHHQLRTGGEIDPMVAVLMVAEQLAYEQDCAMVPVTWPEEGAGEPLPPPPGSMDSNPQALVLEARETLGLGDARLEPLRREALELMLRSVEPVPAAAAAADRAARPADRR